jgi:hypothetical protein
MKEILKALKESLGSELGKIEIYLHESLVPESNLILNGGTVQVADYSDFATLIKNNPERFEGFTLTDTQITLPDYEGYYLGHKKDKLGVKSPDTMRKIVGSIGGDVDLRLYRDSGVEIQMGGALNVAVENNVQLRLMGDASTKHILLNSINFDSSLGVEGQEGTVSPNVGEITEPQNIGVLFTIRAKALVNFDNLIFEDINDFEEASSIEGEYFLTSSGKKIALDALITKKISTMLNLMKKKED